MVRRTYECTDCSTVFEVTLDSGDDGHPDCPTCSKVLEWRPSKVSIGGSNRSKAVDMAQNIMEQDYGLTNFKDNNREGDVGYVAPQKTTQDKEKEMQREAEAFRAVVTARPELQPAAEAFFGGQVARIGNNQVPVTQMIAAGKTGPGANVNPMDLLHKMGREGKLPNNYRIIARDSGK